MQAPQTGASPVPRPLLERASVARALVVGEWFVVVLLGLRLIHWISLPENTDQADFVYYYYPAASRLVHGLSAYSFVVPRWGDSFINPPWFALLVVPLALLPLKAAASCWLALNLGLLAVMVFLGARLCNLRLGLRRTVLVWLALALWSPVAMHNALGQSALVAAAGAVGAVVAADRGKPWLAGLLMVVAASKPQIAFLLGLGLTIWSWRSRRSVGVPAGFAIGVAASVLLVLAFRPALVRDIIGAHAQAYDYWGNTVNLRTLLALPFGPNVISEAIYWTAFVLGSAAIMVSWATSRRPLPNLAALTCAATLLLTPYAQIPDYVLLVLPLMLLAAYACAAPAPRRAVLLAALILAVWAIASLNQWLLRLVEVERIWAWLEARVGEKGMEFLWENLKWNTRFIVMLLPVAFGWALILSGRRGTAEATA